MSMSDEEESIVANYFLDSIDETVDPCDNFYQFACGKWIKQAAIPSYSKMRI